MKLAQDNTMSLSPAKLVLHCYVRKVEDQWVGMCLDFDLAVQADTQAEARKKLIEQISSYFVEAMQGDHAAELLTRRAPISEWTRYWAYYAIAKLKHAKSRVFRLSLPLTINVHSLT